MPAPRVFVLLAALAALEGLAMIGYAGVVAFNAISGASYGVIGNSTSAMVIEIVIFAVLGLGLLAVARGWLRMSRWARGPFILAQLLGLLAGASFAFGGGSSGDVLAGMILGVPSLVGLVLSFNPVVLRSYSESYRTPGSDLG